MIMGFFVVKPVSPTDDPSSSSSSQVESGSSSRLYQAIPSEDIGYLSTPNLNNIEEDDQSARKTTNALGAGRTQRDTSRTRLYVRDRDRESTSSGPPGEDRHDKLGANVDLHGIEMFRHFDFYLVFTITLLRMSFLVIAFTSWLLIADFISSLVTGTGIMCE